MLMVLCQCGCDERLAARSPRPVSKYARGHKPPPAPKRERADEEVRDVLWTQ